MYCLGGIHPKWPRILGIEGFTVNYATGLCPDDHPTRYLDSELHFARGICSERERHLVFTVCLTSLTLNV